jgi:hypothetical protein
VTARCVIGRDKGLHSQLSGGAVVRVAQGGEESLVSMPLAAFRKLHGKGDIAGVS